MPISLLDLIALGCFTGAWIAYAVTLEWTPYGQSGLNSLMNRHREIWMERMLERDVRIVDAQLMVALQNGTAFFASTTLLAIGGTLTIFRSSDAVLAVVTTLPFGVEMSRLQWEIKVIGLAIILMYAFFKFAWSYRLFNYVVILLGSAPPYEERATDSAKAFGRRTARLLESAGRHFNRGQRAFFFAIGYLGWFIGPWILIASTLAVVLVMWRRQFASDSRRALLE